MDKKDYLSIPPIQALSEKIRGGTDLIIEELFNAPKALLTSIAQKVTGKHIILITSGLKETQLFNDFPFFTDKIPLEFPAWESLPSEEMPPSADVVGDRYRILRQIQESQEPQIILTNLQAVLQKILPPKQLEALHLVLKTGTEFLFEELPHRLSEMGYHRRSVAADKGEFAVRGGIVDVYPVSSPDPFRIEFWEEEIVSIRIYDPVGQVSVRKVKEILITPGEELQLLSSQTELATLFDYLGSKSLVIFDDMAQLEDKYVTLKSLMGGKLRSFSTLDDFFQSIEALQKIYLIESPLEEISEVRLVERPQKIEFEALNRTWQAERWRHPFKPLFPTFCPPDCSLDDFSADDFLQLLSRFSEEIAIHFVCQTPAEMNQLKQRLEKSISVSFEEGYLSSGFYLQEPPTALIPMTELTHRYKVRRQKQRSHYHTLPVELMTLTTGEAVVHIDNGIGHYLGMEKHPNHLGIETEYLVVEYAEGAKLYVPMEQSNLLSNYIGVTGEEPQRHTLGSSRWKRSRERTEQAIMGYAKDLLKLQAERVVSGGFVYPTDSEMILQFNEEFPYVETADQLVAIEAIQNDMQSNTSMDRLICGDVGYGKTEVAMRAAFKTVVDGGKQVALLVPTTVLALQHYETLTERMANFPVSIGVVSRFRKPKQVKQTLEGVAQGTIDILIGTHRLVSGDVQFKDLGLLIIDEEQRFGVRTKERLKKMRKAVDCLTLSATPIPRTLYLSLVGARDLSVINTPPEDRLPIHSIVCQSSDEIIKNTLLRELARDGQAYVIHNRVETIYKMADRIRKLIPEARLVVGHGQMSAEELDTVFHAFKSGQANILVATSIVENGIDIPNANTMLIDRADRFGLADLYQMRGRVGRWTRKAYCYFLIPNTINLSEIAHKRLSALTQITGYGGGMKIAMQDLEIRGAGNILGTEQSGHVAAIGFHLYCKLLKKVIDSLQKQEKPFFSADVKMEFPCDARIPESYIDETDLRIEMYQRLGDTTSNEEIDLLIEELKDRFGPLPVQVEWLHKITRIRQFAKRNYFIQLKLTKGIFLAVQSHGKKDKVSKRLPISPPETPEELEETILTTLKQHFPIKGYQ